MRRITFTAATFSRPFSRIYSLILQFRAHPSEVGLWLRTGASPILRLRPPKADKQVAEHTAPPPALHFRISPAYRSIYPHHETPWGTHRAKPAQGRATFTPIVLRWRHGGGNILSLPLAAGLPLLKRQKGGVYSRRSASLHSGRKPVRLRLKGGGTAPGPWPGVEREKKRKRPCLRFFPVGRLPASSAATPPQRGVLRPPGFSASHQVKRTKPHG
jgi:hypothetical protein